MNLVYYKTDIGNVGDDLNPWLWQQIFGDFNLYDENTDFYGIGSILSPQHFSGNAQKKTIIFGSGVRDFLFTPNINEHLDVCFLRGPISSKVFGGAPYITDAAYCLATLPKLNYEKKYKVSYIPYFRHVPLFNWKLFEKTTGIKIILPTDPIEKVLREINESEKILTSAMHGAIFADIYRVPWTRVKFSQHGSESPITSELKWFDWYNSIGFDEIHTLSFGYTFYSKDNSIINFIKLLSMYIKFRHFPSNLSDISIFDKKIEQLKEKITYIKKKYKQRIDDQ